MKVSQAVEQFIIYGRVEKQYAPETQSKIKECFDSWLFRHFGNLDLAEIKPVHLLTFRQVMDERKLSVARQYSLLMTLKLFLKFCRKVLEIQCLDPDTIRLPRRAQPKVDYLTNEEVRAIRECMDSSSILGLRKRALFETLLATGMRISEAISLDRDSINRDTKQATIIGKGRKQRVVFFSDEALKWIDRYESQRRDTNQALFVTYGEQPKRWSRGDIPRFFKALAQAAGIQKKVTPHMLRHTFCTNLRNHGADISLIKDLAGHQDIDTTARYYLGSDTRILKDAVGRYLNYSSDGPAKPHPVR